MKRITLLGISLYKTMNAIGIPVTRQEAFRYAFQTFSVPRKVIVRRSRKIFQGRWMK